MNEALSPPEDNESWAPCDTGRLAGLASRLQADHGRRQRARVARTATVAAGALALMAAIVTVLPTGERSAAPGKIACAECQDRFSEYAAFLAVDAAEPGERIQEAIDHLAECPACRAAFDQRHPGLRAVAASYGLTSLAALAVVAGSRRWSSRRQNRRG